jgi:RNA polymerase sigma factor (sigma-70 family)
MPAPESVSFEGLFALHYEGLLRFAYLLTGGRDAEDLVQEAFLRAHRRWDPARAHEAFPTYARTTVLRIYLNRARSAARETRALIRLRPVHAREDAAPPVDAVRAISTLPPRMRSLLFQARDKLRQAGYGNG